MSNALRVSREKLPEQNGAMIDGIWRPAGRILDIRTNPLMNDFLPKGLAITWVSLQGLAPLDVHVHPIESFVAIVKGNAKVRGEDGLKMKAGDVVHIPPCRWHGFEAVDEKGFWGLSWQFADSHLFETKQRLVFFPGETDVDTTAKCRIFDSCEKPITSVHAPEISFQSRIFRINETQIFDPIGRELWTIGRGNFTIDFADQRVELSEGDSLSIDPNFAPHISVRSHLEESLLSRFVFNKVVQK